MSIDTTLPAPTTPEPINARKLPASMGWAWLHQGWSLYRRQPVAMTGILVTYLFCAMLIARVPIIGMIVTLLTVPGCSTGFLIAAREIERGNMPMPTTLIEAFSKGSGPQMWKLGLVYFLVVTLGIASVVWVGGEPLVQALEKGAQGGKAEMPANLPLILGAMVAIFTPLVMAYWYAPVLVHWHGVSPTKALFFSWVACWRNKGAFTVYFVICGLLLMTFRTLAGSIALLLGLDAGTAELIGIPFSLLLASIMYSSFYPSYTSVFLREPAAA